MEKEELTQANTLYKKAADVVNGVKNAKQNLMDVELAVLQKIADRINRKLIEYSHFVFGDDREEPYLSFTDNTHYCFITKGDNGTGKRYTDLILFDLAVLSLTSLPVLVHDSLLLKNIGDSAVEKILDLYQASGKQIFIAMDKAGSYSEKTTQILNGTKVIELHSNGGELFGYSWSKKKTE